MLPLIMGQPSGIKKVQEFNLFLHGGEGRQGDEARVSRARLSGEYKAFFFFTVLLDCRALSNLT